MENRFAILGHKSPDVDSILSGYLLTSYLRYKKYDVEYVIPDEVINEDVLSVLKRVGVDINNFSRNILSTAKLILVDHNETEFSNEVVAIIDHHPTLKNNECKFYINEKSSSTTKHIYDLVCKECPSYISARFVYLVLVGMAVDTRSFRSTKATKGDKEWFLKMCEEYELSSQEILEIGDCITDISNTDKVMYNDYKEYNFNDSKVATSQIYIKSDLKDEKLEYILENLKEKVKNEKLYMWTFMVINLENSTSNVFKIKQDCIEHERYSYIISRAIDVMPRIEKEIMS